MGLFKVRSGVNPPRMTCCPEGSTGQRTAQEAGGVGVAKGKLIMLEHGDQGETMRVYVTGTPTDEAGAPRPVVLVCHDIFGFNSARTHYICDHFADLGYFVVAPDFFDAKLVEFKQREWIWAKLTDAMNLLCNPMQAWSRVTMPYAKVESKVNATILPWIRQQTTGKIGLIGFCWGSWAMFHMSGSGDFACAAHMHSSFIMVRKGKRPPEEGTAKEVVSAITCPQLLINSPLESKVLHADGWVSKLLQEKGLFGGSFLYPKISHGFFNRGDLRNTAVKEAYEDALQRTTDFFAQHLLSANGEATTATATATPKAQ